MLNYKLELPKAERRHLKEAYRQADVILEYGSGGSTVFAASLTQAYTISVESDRAYAIELQAFLDKKGMTSPVIVQHVDIGPTGAWGRPVNADAWAQFHHYPLAIWQKPYFRHPDLVFIDGRFRPACFAAVCLKIDRPTRVLFDDYYEREIYHAVEKLVAPDRKIGRMAEFHLIPQKEERLDLDLMMSLFSEATYSRGGRRYDHT